MKVAVLGCGPAGLLATHAAVQEGCEVEIIAPGSPSKIAGAQYIHSAIPDATEPGDIEMVTYAKVGTKEGYARKVYGTEDAPVSWDIFGIGEYPAWPMERVYERLWQRYLEDEVHPVVHIPASINGQWVHLNASKYDLILSSIPVNSMCLRPDHMFKGQKVYIGEVPIIGVRNLVVYNGREDEPWYRASNLFGHASMEISAAAWEHEMELGDGPTYSQHTGPAYTLMKGIKPIHTNCDCHLHHPNYKRIGRFGTWSKGVLVSHAYRDALNTIAARKLNVVH